MTIQSATFAGPDAAKLLANANDQGTSKRLDALRNSINGKDAVAARDAAEQFEAVFISQFLAPIFDSVPTDGPFGGGHAEGIYRGLLVEEIGNAIASKGGFGIADSVYGEILKLQEV